MPVELYSNGKRETRPSPDARGAVFKLKKGNKSSI